MTSSGIRTAQVAPHHDLAQVVARHARNVFQKPIAKHSMTAFVQFVSAWQAAGNAPLILDAGCGVGESTLHIARSNPDAFVVGIDRSAVRIDTRKTWWQGEMPDNLLWLRADLVDFWRLLADELARRQTHLHKHFILYPNPYPKIGQLGKRWHGHAIFPTIIALGGRLEVRSNWAVYVEEFAQAVAQLTGVSATFHGQWDALPMTPFERKYQTRTEILWRAVFDLSFF